jgi:hypothetical protein
MNIINVIIANRGRSTHLDSCLYHLSKANINKRHDVCVYVVTDNLKDLEHVISCKQDNIDIVALFKAVESKHFNKSILLNHGLNKMRSDYSFFSIVDVDMNYSNTFFDVVSSKAYEKAYIVCQGRNQDSTVNRGPSQITLSKKLYQLFLQIYGENFYDESFVGYGAEDSEISFKSRDMKNSGLLDKIILPDMWIHVYHEKRELSINNLELFEFKKQNNKIKLMRWLEHENSNTYLQESRGN